MNRLGSLTLRWLIGAGMFLTAHVTSAAAIGHPYWVDNADYPEPPEVIFVEKHRGKNHWCEAVVYRLIDRADTPLREFRVVDSFKVSMQECRH